MRWHHRLGLIFNAQVTDLASHIVPVRLVCVGSVTLSAAIVGKNTSLMAGLVSLAIGLLLYCAAESFIRSVNTLANPAMKLLVSLFVAVAVGCLLPRSLKPEAFQFGGDLVAVLLLAFVIDRRARFLESKEVWYRLLIFINVLGLLVAGCACAIKDGNDIALDGMKERGLRSS
jgi:hypothetical protein